MLPESVVASDRNQVFLYPPVGCSVFQCIYMIDMEKSKAEIKLSYYEQLYAKSILSAVYALEVLNKYGYGIGTLRPEAILLEIDYRKKASSKVLIKQRLKLSEANPTKYQYPYYDHSECFHPSDDLKALLVIMLRTQYILKNELNLFEKIVDMCMKHNFNVE